MPVPLILPSSSSTDGVSLQTYRKRLARTLGFYAEGTVTTQASSLEAERYILSSSMLSDQQPPERFDGLFAFVRDGDQGGVQRKLANGAFDGSLGALAMDYPYSAALEAGTAYEIAVLPAKSYQGVTGLNDAINEALEELPVVDVVQVTTVADQVVYSLAGYPWPVKSVTRLFYPRTSTSDERRREAPKTWEFIPDAENPTLQFTSVPFNAGDVFEVELLRPATSRIRTSGVWGDSTVGLVNESDQALYDAATVVREARPIALRYMALMFALGSKERERITLDAEGDEARAALSRFYNRFRGSGAIRVKPTGAR